MDRIEEIKGYLKAVLSHVENEYTRGYIESALSVTIGIENNVTYIRRSPEDEQYQVSVTAWLCETRLLYDEKVPKKITFIVNVRVDNGMCDGVYDYDLITSVFINGSLSEMKEVRDIGILRFSKYYRKAFLNDWVEKWFSANGNVLARFEGVVSERAIDLEHSLHGIEWKKTMLAATVDGEFCADIQTCNDRSQINDDDIYYASCEKNDITETLKDGLVHGEIRSLNQLEYLATPDGWYVAVWKEKYR